MMKKIVSTRKWGSSDHPDQFRILSRRKIIPAAWKNVSAAFPQHNNSVADAIKI